MSFSLIPLRAHTLCLLICIAHFSESNYVYDFQYEGKVYTIITNRRTTQPEAEHICQNEYGSSLAQVPNINVLSVLDNEMSLLKDNLTGPPGRIHELWIWGRTNVGQGSYLNLTVDIPRDQGVRCVILSDYYGQSPLPLQEYNMYGRNCADNSEKNLICEKAVGPMNVKYIIGSSPAYGCPQYATKVFQGSVLMSRSGCLSFQGIPITSPSVELMVECKLNWCGTNVTEIIEYGIVAAKPGHCPGDDPVEGMVKSIPIQYCDAFNDNMAGYNSSARVNCPIEWCRYTKPSIHNIFPFSTRNNYCELPRINSRPIPMDSNVCSENINAENMFGVKPESVCNLFFCKVGMGSFQGCKTTQMGKEYTGKLSTTISGKECQRWDTNYPHEHGNHNPNWFPEDSISDAANYCRNPAGWAEGPFCFTTDPDVLWELCDIPFCTGKGPTIVDMHSGNSHYIFIPGQHSDPWPFCQKMYGADGAIMQSLSEIEKVSHWLNQLRTNGETVEGEIWVGGRVPTSQTQRGNVITNMEIIDPRANTGYCLLLSSWNHKTNSFDSDSLKLYADNCPQYYRQFICEDAEYKIENYQVDGGVVKMEIHDVDTCKFLCTGECYAVGFHEYEQSCWHYSAKEDCKPGRYRWGFSYYQKTPCECHKYLLMMDDNVTLEASSFEKASGNILPNTVDRARLDTVEEVTPYGILRGAWVPAYMNDSQWIQAHFITQRLVYGVLTRGMAGLSRGMVLTFVVKYSTSPTCNTWISIMENNSSSEMIFTSGNANRGEAVTTIFDSAVFAQCVRIVPKTWAEKIALRFDLLGCIEPLNRALGKPVLLGSSEKVVSDENSPAVDGFMHSTFNWNSCMLSQAKMNSWIAVDLQQMYIVDKIKIYSRRECCDPEDGQLRLLNIRVHMEIQNLKNANVAPGQFSTQQCAFISGAVKPASSVTVTCSPSKLGRYVVIQKEAHSHQDRIAVCEVKVYGQLSDVQNVALYKPATQSHTVPGHPAKYANDGNMNTINDHFSKTESKNPWWMVDLEKDYTIYEVSLTVNKICCEAQFSEGMFVHIGNTLDQDNKLTGVKICAAMEDDVSLGTTTYINCERPLDGRYVKVGLISLWDTLSLVEVQVFGHIKNPAVYGGNTSSTTCKIPFIYNGKSYSHCITTKNDSTHLWCATTENYDRDLLWGYCVDVRLVGGRSSNEGTVYVRDNKGKWGTICDDDWDNSEAMVVCKHLGYTGGIAKYPPFFEPGVGTILMGNLQCKGQESSLYQCNHTSLAQYCTHDEDAAVICSDPDNVMKVGYPAIRRSQKDNLKEGIIIMPTTQEIKAPGTVKYWKFYSTKSYWKFHSTKNNSIFKLQIWRQLYDVKGYRMTLVDQVIATESLVENEPVTIINPTDIKVEQGDLIGFSFTNGNPISFDQTFNCDIHGKIIYKAKPEATVGSVHSFSTKFNPSVNCRVYSLSAGVLVQEMKHLKEFLYGGKYYRIYLSQQNMPASDHLCKINMDAEAHLYHIDTKSQFHHTKQMLVEMGLKGSFWTRNNVTDRVFSSSWAPCQPEKGKECLVISNNNDDGIFQVYSRSCADKNYFICENKTEGYTTPNDIDDVTTIEPTAKDSHGSSHKTVKVHQNLLLLVLLILLCVILLVVVIIIIIICIRRRRQKKWKFPVMFSRLTTSESTSPLNTADVNEYHDNVDTNRNEQSGVKSDEKSSPKQDTPTTYVDSDNNIGPIENPMYDSTTATSSF